MMTHASILQISNVAGAIELQVSHPVWLPTNNLLLTHSRSRNELVPVYLSKLLSCTSSCIR